MLRHTNQFKRTYRCKECTFFLLVDILRDDIVVDITRSLASSNGNTPIYPELIVAAGLQHLIGTSHRSIMLIYGVSIASAYRLVNMFLDAVDKSEDARLSIRLPSTASELQTHAEGWSCLSQSDGLFYGVVGCIDGWLCCTNRPFDAINASDYFCGHYQRYGLNVQAVCDYKLRFIYLSTVATGRTNDLCAFQRSVQLQQWLNNLPPQYFILGDNAYPLTSRVLIRFPALINTSRLTQLSTFSCLNSGHVSR